MFMRADGEWRTTEQTSSESDGVRIGWVEDLCPSSFARRKATLCAEYQRESVVRETAGSLFICLWFCYGREEKSSGCSISAVRVHGVHAGRVRFPAARQKNSGETAVGCFVIKIPRESKCSVDSASLWERFSSSSADNPAFSVWVHSHRRCRISCGAESLA